MTRVRNASPLDLAEGVARRRPRAELRPGSPQFCEAVLDTMRNLWPFVHANWHTFERELALVRQFEAWRFLPSPDAPYGSEEAMLQAAVGAGVKEVYGTLAVSRAQAEADNPRPIMTAPESGALGGRGNKGRDNYNGLSDDRGVSASYLTARIARDHPAILERMKAGEFRSVRAAAIEAGIVKPDTSMTIPTDVPGIIRALRRRLTPEQWADLIALLAGEGG